MHLPLLHMAARSFARALARVGTAASLLLASAGVSAAAPAMPATPPPSRWVELRRDDLRVATVMYHLAIANRLGCPDALAPQPGFALHGITQYGPADRAEAALSFGLGSHVGVMAVVAGSPAARAGLRADDQLISVNGRELGSFDSAGAAPTNAPMEAARQVLLDEMRKGEVTLRVAGAEGDRAVRFTAEPGCRSIVELVPGNVVNASADGKRIMVSAGLLARCDTDDDLALVIAHELAHNLLHHAARLARLGITGNGFLDAAGSGTAEMRETEEEADQLGVRLVLAARYDLAGAASFLRGLQAGRGAGSARSTHPGPERRRALLEVAIAEASRGTGPKAASHRGSASPRTDAQPLSRRPG